MDDALLAFICHASEDSPQAIQVKTTLESNGINVFIDTDDIHGDHSFVERINTALATCTHFVVLLSSASTSKHWPKHEMLSITRRVVKNEVSFFAFVLDGYAMADFQDSFPTLAHVPIRRFHDQNLALLPGEVFGLSRKPALGDLPRAARLAKHPALSPAAFALAKWLCEHSERGMDGDPRVEVSKEFVRDLGLAMIEFQDAVDELESRGCICNSPAAGCWDIASRACLFVEFDPHFMQWIPEGDARTLALRLMANSPEGEVLQAETLAIELNWPPRRMNPAIQWLIQNDLLESRNYDLGDHLFLQYRLFPNRSMRRFVVHGRVAH